MIQGCHVLSIIPARSGSKGLPGKNIKFLYGKPLIAWTILQAKHSHYLDEIMVSTDSPDIASIAKEYGASIPVLRPAELAADTSPTIDCVLHALSYYQHTHNRCFDYVCLLEPTSPLREDQDIDTMLKKLIDSHEKFDSIISIGEVHAHPSIMKKKKQDALFPYTNSPDMLLRRQDLAPVYFPYGGIYIASTEALMTEKTFYARRSTYYEVKRYQNYEIDDIYDFLSVEAIMKYEWKNHYDGSNL